MNVIGKAVTRFYDARRSLARAFYTGAARTASIVAVEDSRVQILHRDALLRMRTEHPSLAMRFDHMVIRKLAGSLERTNTLIATLG